VPSRQPVPRQNNDRNEFAVSGTYPVGDSHVLPSKNAYRLMAESFQVDSVKQFFKKQLFGDFSNPSAQLRIFTLIGS